MRAACDFRENDGAAGGEEGHLTARLVDLGAQLARCDGDIGARIAAREGNGGTRLDDGEAPAGRGDLRAVEHADRLSPHTSSLSVPLFNTTTGSCGGEPSGTFCASETSASEPTEASGEMEPARP